VQGETDCWKTHPDDGCQAWTTPEQARKRHFFRHLYIKCIILPRQARDDHRKNSKKVPFSSRSKRSVSRRGRRCGWRQSATRHTTGIRRQSRQMMATTTKALLHFGQRPLASASAPTVSRGELFSDRTLRSARSGEANPTTPAAKSALRR
jgi:hypothetical protein